MSRIIEILKEFQNNSWSLSLPYLIEKFSLTTRTLQKDIQRINTLLAEVSNCRIIKNSNLLIVTGRNPEAAINSLLAKFLKPAKNDLAKTYQLFLYFVCNIEPLSNSRLIGFASYYPYSLSQKLRLLNNFFNFYDVNLTLKFKVKKGWILSGCEEDLRILTTNIFINSPHPNIYLDSNWFHIYGKLDEILLQNKFYFFYFHELIYFLMVMIKRIKVNRMLNKYYNHSFLEQFKHHIIDESHFQKLVKMLEETFVLKFNVYELRYLKDIMFFNQKVFDDSLFFDIKKLIDNLIFKEYQFLLDTNDFNWALNNFLKENYLRLWFGYYKSFDLNDVGKNKLLNNSSYYGWEILTIFLHALRKIKFKINFNLFINDYFLAIFNNLYLQSSPNNWKIPLYYQPISSYYHEVNKVVFFIKTKYPNIDLQPLDMDNKIYKLNLLNQNYNILIDDNITLNPLQYNKIFLLKYNTLISNQQLQEKLELVIKMLMFDKICSSIMILDFFSKQKFCSLNGFLALFQNFLIRKFKINWISFDLNEAFISSKFLQQNILVVHKTAPINNSEIPLILIYLKTPLFFKNNPIHFIFILITNSNTLYQYDWIILYLNIIKNNLSARITTVKSLYQFLKIPY